MITSFTGKHRFLSNFYAAPIVYRGDRYPTSEHLYQALKTAKPSERDMVRRAISPGRAKQLGQTVTLRDSFDSIATMYLVVDTKFKQHEDLAEKLIATSPHALIEGNTWNDKRWGMVWRHNGWVGENWLGKLLMLKRAELTAD